MSVLAFSHTAQPQVLEAQYVSAQPYDAFSWTMNQKRQCYALISIPRGGKNPNIPLKRKNKRSLVRSLYCLLSSLKNRTQKSFDTFAIPCALPLDHKGSVGDDMVPPRLGAVLSGQLIKTCIPSLPNSVHFNLFNSHGKSKVKSGKSRIVTQL